MFLVAGVSYGKLNSETRTGLGRSLSQGGAKRQGGYKEFLGCRVAVSSSEALTLPESGARQSQASQQTQPVVCPVVPEPAPIDLSTLPSSM